MCKVSLIHEACEAGARDGRNFPLESCVDEIVRIFSKRYYDDDRARAAYVSNFWMEVGRRVSPVRGARFARA